MVEHRRRRLAADRKVAGLGQMLDSRVQLAGERDGALEDGGRQPVGVVGHDQAAYRPVAEDDPQHHDRPVAERLRHGGRAYGGEHTGAGICAARCVRVSGVTAPAIPWALPASGPRRHAYAALASICALVVVTLAIAALKTFVPVISLGILYVFAVLPVAVLFGAR